MKSFKQLVLESEFEHSTDLYWDKHKANNGEMSQKDLHEISTKGTPSDVVMSLLNHKDEFHPETLHHLAINNNDSETHRLILSHNNVEPKTLHHIIDSNAKDDYMLYHAGSHVNANDEVIKHSLDKSNNPVIRATILKNPNISNETLINYNNQNPYSPEGFARKKMLKNRGIE